MINDDADDVRKELFDSLKNIYQSNLESMKGNKILFDYVHLLHYKCHRINPNHDRSYIDSLDWIKTKKATRNPITVTVALNHKQIKKDLQRITKVKPFINKYNWGGINLPSEKDDWDKFEKNKVTISLNVLYNKKEKVYPGYVSKHNSNREKQVILLTVSKGNICIILQ